MGQKVLGLDIGSYSIKGAIFDVAFRSFILTDLYESKPLNIDEVSAQEKSEKIQSALKSLISENKIDAHTTVSAIPGTSISTRLISLPFSQKKVDKVLAFELESYLPFDMQDLIIDSHTVKSGKNNTSLLAIAVKKDIIKEHLNVFEGTSLDPRFVDVDSFSLLNVWHMLNLETDDPVALVDIGHGKTTVSIIAGKTLQTTRTLFTAGRHLTNALRMKMDLTLAQAEEVKIKHGILDDPSSPALKKEVAKISAILRETIDPLIEEVKQTIQSYKAQHSKDESEVQKSVGKIYLCGGTSLLRNIDNYFTQKTSLQTYLLHCFPPSHEISQKLGPRERMMTGAISLGLKLALRGQDKSLSEVNLRKEEFTYKHEFKNIRSRLSFVGTLLFILIAFIVVNFSTRYYKLSQKRSKIDKATLAIMADTLEDFSKLNINSADKAKRIIEDRIRKSKKQIEILTAGLNESSALTILNEISSRMPKEITVDVSELNINKNSVVFRGETDSFASVDKMINELKGFEGFSKVEKGEIKDAADPNKKKFSINITAGEPLK